MKKLFLSGLVLFTIIACQNSEPRYTQKSAEIDIVKTLINNYNSKAYDMSIYADTSKTFYNTKDKGMTPSETIDYHQTNDVNYSSRSFLKEDQEYEMVVTDDDQTWVNCWLDWKGTLASTGKEVTIPIHLTYQFVDGKIVREYGLWDPTEIVLELQAMDSENNDMVKVADNYIKAWSDNDHDLLKSITSEDVIRVANGETTSKGQAGIIQSMNFWHTTIPDFNIKKRQAFSHGNKVYSSWTSTGTNTGNFGENPPTGKRSITQGFTVLTFNNDGKIKHEVAYYDLLSVMNQWGYSVLPPSN